MPSLFETSLSIGATMIAMYGLYGAALWSIGAEQYRRRAIDVWHDMLETAILFTISWFIPSIAIWIGCQIQSSVYPNATAHWKLPSLDSPWTVLSQNAVITGLKNAEAVFTKVATDAVDMMVELSYLIIATGVVPFTQTISLALSQLTGILFTTASFAIFPSWVFAYTAKFVEALLGFFPVLALLIATGRRLLASLGAALISFAAIASAALPLAATAISVAMSTPLQGLSAETLASLLPKSSDIMSTLLGIANPLGTIASTFHALLVAALVGPSSFYAQVLVIYVMTAFITAAAIAALSYALSGVPHVLEVPV